ncbi:Cellular nucleic acid-binding protein-like [Gracilariopsis chorda]|uniref:Cellular nucleic acid-binding protein-like n=1 Tax=Gracilariopsis chorda TaxID=448386 RepID=A0A2V3ITH2_9FLOR|nr:Cellular nucleic acid-binding protein-like [Gracilariopsis chorda]|eukprot:PXF45428.1 Cellular nucleic acid-binding protein-like [Gracilariopsis chorda]
MISTAQASLRAEEDAPAPAPARAPAQEHNREVETAEARVDSSGDEQSSSSEDAQEAQSGEQGDVEGAVNGGGMDVMQNDARYFMVANVVCSFCGLKGHRSYDCEEEEEQQRCFLCGGKGHSSRNCPDETCHQCKQRGHRARDCAMKGMKRRVRRECGPPRELVADCFVCGKAGHLDCSLEKMMSGVLSCFNCGQKGHNGANCNIPSIEKMIPIVLEMERGRKMVRTGERKKRRTEEGVDEASSFRETFMERALQRRFKGC